MTEAATRTAHTAVILIIAGDLDTYASGYGFSADEAREDLRDALIDSWGYGLDEARAVADKAAVVAIPAAR